LTTVEVQMSDGSAFAEPSHKGRARNAGYPCWCDSGEDALPERRYRKLSANRWLAHQLIFATRHPGKSYEADRELVERIHGPPRPLRAVGKTTELEEACYCTRVSASSSTW